MIESRPESGAIRPGCGLGSTSRLDSPTLRPVSPSQEEQVVKNCRGIRDRLGQGLLALAVAFPLTSSAVALAADSKTPASGAAAEASDVKLGLTLAKRKAVFLELAAAERRAEREAASAHSDDPESMAEVDLTQRLSLEYKDAVAKKHGLTREQAVELSVEGARGGWPVE